LRQGTNASSTEPIQYAKNHSVVIALTGHDVVTAPLIELHIRQAPAVVGVIVDKPELQPVAGFSESRSRLLKLFCKRTYTFPINLITLSNFGILSQIFKEQSRNYLRELLSS
jgi:hypothetical protein